MVVVKEESLHSILAGNWRWAAPGALMREGDRAAQVPCSTQRKQRARASLLAQPKVLSGKGTVMLQGNAPSLGHISLAPCVVTKNLWVVVKTALTGRDSLVAGSTLRRLFLGRRHVQVPLGACEGTF